MIGFWRHKGGYDIALEKKVADSETAIMIDSTTPLTDEMAGMTYILDDPKNNSHLGSGRPAIFRVPIYLIYTGKDGNPISVKENSIDDLDAFKSGNGIQRFTSSQPTCSDFLKLYDIIRGYGFSKAIGMFLSDRLTGTNNEAMRAAGDYKDIEFELVDTKTGSGELTIAVEQMLEHTHEGFDRMVEAGKHAVERARIYFSVENLEELRNSGRLSEAGMLLASLLRIKPIITVGKNDWEDGNYGRMYVKEKIFGSNIIRTIPRLVEYAQRAVENYKSSRGLAYVVDIRLGAVADSLYSRLMDISMFRGGVKRVKETSNIMYTLVGPAVAVATLPLD